MKGTDSGLDLGVGVIVALSLLVTCIWSLGANRENLEAIVEERAAVTNVYGEAAAEPVQTGRDLILAMVVNDAYLPDPTLVVFIDGAHSYPVRFDTNYFKDKEASIAAAWDAFFKDRLDKVVTSTELDVTNNRWVVTLGGA